jgi:hypothetical protein
MDSVRLRCDDACRGRQSPSRAAQARALAVDGDATRRTGVHDIVHAIEDAGDVVRDVAAQAEDVLTGVPRGRRRPTEHQKG